MLEASGVGAEVDIERLPLSPAIVDYAGRERALHYAMSGGDDYELCFTLPAGRLPADLRCTAIGRITDRDGLLCYLDGELVPFDSSGYRHFR